ncbi:MAG: RidA family protein [Chitinophagales bacterium]|nr:RidA family protein [Chitinophagales bacterium]
MEDKFTTGKAPKPVGLYPHSRRSGNLLFLSGIGPRDATTDHIPGNVYDENGNLLKYDMEAQCHSVFKNVKTVLEESGSDWNKLLDVTVFLTDMKKDFDIYNKLYAIYFEENQPCRTTVEIKSLPTPIAIELKCIATIDR